MKEAVKKKWIKALRSGKYKQGRQALRSDKNKYCCLGVLCDLYAKENPKSKQKWGDVVLGSYNFGTKNRGDVDTAPTSTVLKWAGLKEADVGEFICLNDEECRSFKFIANHIEKHK